ncbi:unnamed protein product [Arctogadus glacialis]
MLGHFGQEIASEDNSATATTFIDATSAKRDAIPMMRALRSYGGLHFSSACEMLIRDYAEIFPEWVKLAKAACVIPVSSVPVERGFSLQNRIKKEGRVTRLMRIASSRDTLDTIDFNSAVARFTAAKYRRK